MFVLQKDSSYQIGVLLLSLLSFDFHVETMFNLCLKMTRAKMSTLQYLWEKMIQAK